uniref:C2H2-type domain-containing protein n=1 Tax=Romanomermis culicivorax TaxID=13658 RepID=A0A915HV99_ROMCU
MERNHATFYIHKVVVQTIDTEKEGRTTKGGPGKSQAKMNEKWRGKSLAKDLQNHGRGGNNEEVLEEDILEEVLEISEEEEISENSRCQVDRCIVCGANYVNQCKQSKHMGPEKEWVHETSVCICTMRQMIMSSLGPHTCGRILLFFGGCSNL